MNNRQVFVGGLVLLGSSLCAFGIARVARSGQAGNPISFNPGEVAKASEINANFTALDARADALEDIPLPRPPFDSDSESTTLTIRAALNVPHASRSFVRINDQIMELTADLGVDMTVSGFGGLDAGVGLASKVYYVYVALQPPSALLGIVSLNSPAGIGPAGTNGAWSYLGSFLTDSNANIAPFVFTQGVFSSWSQDVGAEVVVTATTSQVAKTVLIPDHAFEVRGRAQLSNGSSNDTFSIGPVAGAGLNVLTFPDMGAGGQLGSLIGFVSVPILEPKTLYLTVTDAGTQGRFRVLGWREEPTRFQ